MIRYELAWLERAGLLDHPHTSAGRVPTETGYRYYAERLVVGRAPARRLPARAAGLAGGRRRRCRPPRRRCRRSRTCSSLASAPPVSATVIRHVELLLLQPQIVMAVVITASGNVSKRTFAFDQPVDPKLVESAKSYLNETRHRHGDRQPRAPPPAEAPDLSVREREFLAAIGPVFSDVMEEHERPCSWAAPRG